MTTGTSDPAASQDVHVVRWEHPAPERVLVIAHGYAEHSAYWDATARVLSEQLAAEVVALDFPGHGRSAGERGVVEDVDDLVPALAGVVEGARAARPDLALVLLGHSMGGLVATRAVQLGAARVDLLVLHAGGVLDAEAFVPAAAVADVEAMTVDAELARFIENDPLRVPEPMDARTSAAIRQGGDRALNAAPLGDVPLLWVHGEDDALIPYEQVRRNASRLGARRTVFLGYPGTGHGGVLEADNAAMIADIVAVVRWLA